MTITIKDYYAASGSRFSKKDAEIIGPALGELAERGEVTAQEVVDVARSANSPLHRYFEWDDKRAANLFRVEQARNMLRSIKVKYVENGAEKAGRAFLVTPAATRNDGGLRGYKQFVVLHGDRAVAVHMMRNAMKELCQWRDRYEQHQDDWERVATAFLGVFNQIDEMNNVISDVDLLAEETDRAFAALKEWSVAHSDARTLWAESTQQFRFLHEAVTEAERLFEFVEKKHVRKCISCSREFVSDGAHNRQCDKCRAKASDYLEPAV